MRAWTHIILSAGLAFAAMNISCQSEAPRSEPPETGAVNGNGPDQAKQQSEPVPSSQGIATYSFEVVNAFPHDPAAFTQGLVFHEGTLLESTGQYGSSSLRAVELQTGKVLKRVDLPEQFFAEGMTVFQG